MLAGKTPFHAESERGPQKRSSNRFNRPTVKSIVWLFCPELRYLVFQRIQHADFSFPENFNIEAHAKNTLIINVINVIFQLLK